MDRKFKLALILFIFILLGISGKLVYDQMPNDESFKVILDEATKNAIASGSYTVPEGVTFIESKDCEGTEWIKKQGCSLNGRPMDGTEGSCGQGKEIWILDPEHSDFKPAVGDGKCEPRERDCEVPCPKPCEGDTWIPGSCVRNEYVNGSTIETVLDGTSGKCGEGILKSTLDRNASDFKPAVGSGACVTEKAGACNVPCPVPEPPKCNNYTGWVENVGLGCVANEYTTRKVGCGERGVKQFFNVSTNPSQCAELVKWEDCQAAPCPIDCVGSWSGWGACESSEPCGVQPEKTNTYRHTTAAQHGGLACPYPDGYQLRENCGSITPCCVEEGNWAMVGACQADGTAKYVQTYTENKPGGCPSSAKAKFMACCYQAGDWTDKPGALCNSSGKITQIQTTKNCPESYKTREADCKYVSGWTAVGGCGTDGLQHYTRTVINGTDDTTKTEACPVDCAGYYEPEPSCPTECGFPQTTKSWNWVNTNSGPKNGGADCPAPKTKTCPATSECPPCKWDECKDWARDGPPCWYGRSGGIKSMYWNDGMSSYELKDGCENWEMRAYEHSNYEGQYFVMQGGGRRDVPSGWNDRVSSVKAVPKAK